MTALNVIAVCKRRASTIRQSYSNTDETALIKAAMSNTLDITLLHALRRSSAIMTPTLLSHVDCMKAAIRRP